MAGEPGIGKSELLRRFSRQVCDDGRLVLSGSAADMGQPRPFSLFRDAVCDLEPPGIPADAALSGLRDALSPSADLRPPEWQGGKRSWRDSCYMIKNAFEELAQRIPLALLLDDLHLADPASAELFCYLLCHPPRGNMLALATYRPRQLPVRCAARIGAEQGQHLVHIRLGPLSFDQASALAGSGRSRHSCERLYRDSGGNPRYLAALSERPHEGDIGAAAWAALQAEIAQAPEHARQVAHAAAVVGDHFEPVIVAAVSELPEPVAVAGIDVLAARDLIRAAGPRGFRFRHPAVRQAAYDDAGAGWRLAAHGRAAAWLRRFGAAPSALACHVEKSALPGDTDAVDVLVTAARETIGSDVAVAVGWLDTALRLLPASAHTRRSEVLCHASRALSLAGRFSRAHWAASQALACLPTGKADLRAQSLQAAAVSGYQLGRSTSTALLDQFGSAGDEGYGCRVGPLLALTCHFLVTGNLRAHMRYAAETADAASVAGSTVQQAAASAHLALAHYLAGDVGQSAEHHDRAAAMLDRMPDNTPGAGLDASLLVAWSETSLQRLGQAGRRLARIVDQARAAHYIQILGPALMLRATVSRMAAQFEAAVADLDEVADLAADCESLVWHATARSLQCDVLPLAGETLRACEAGKEAVGLENLLPWPAKGQARAMLAAARLRLGHPPATYVAEVLSACGGPGLPGIDAATRPRWYETLAAADIGTGQAGRARDWSVRADQVAMRVPLPLTAGYALLARARLMMCSDIAKGAELARNAIVHFAAAGATYEAQRAAELSSGVIQPPAASRNARFHEVTGTVPPGLCAGRSDQRTRATRAPVFPRPDHGGLGALSPRERQVATLISEGRTNRQIARHLAISRKTVEAHVSRIFGKLDVSSRVGIATAVVKAVPL